MHVFSFFRSYGNLGQDPTTIFDKWENKAMSLASTSHLLSVWGQTPYSLPAYSQSLQSW